MYGLCIKIHVQNSKVASAWLGQRSWMGGEVDEGTF
jgi:hypothetical protein